ncbi:hypothetical protein JCM1840_005832 [Sporobolomyces johnsonii]
MTTMTIDADVRAFLRESPKLESGGKNFKAWKMRMERAFDMGGLEDLVEGKELRTDENAATWDERAKRAFGYLVQKLNDEELNLIAGLDVPEAWKELVDSFELSTTNVHVSVTATLGTLKAKSSLQVEANVFAAILSISLKLAMNDAGVKSALKTSFTERWTASRE